MGKDKWRSHHLAEQTTHEAASVRGSCADVAATAAVHPHNHFLHLLLPQAQLYQTPHRCHHPRQLNHDHHPHSIRHPHHPTTSTPSTVSTTSTTPTTPTTPTLLMPTLVAPSARSGRRTDLLSTKELNSSSTGNRGR
ncbi:unnamed protein product [Closterium sp. NIES-53]